MSHSPTHFEQTEEQRLAAFADANVVAPPLTPEQRRIGATPTPGTTIVGDDLITQTAPEVTVPEIPDVPSAPPADTTTTDITPETTAPVDDLFSQVESAIEGVSSFDREADVTARTAATQRQLIEKNKQISLHQARSIEQDEAARVSGRTTGFGAVASAKVRRTNAIESLKLSAEKSAIIGELALASQLAGDAVDAEFAEEEANLQAQRNNLISNFDKMTSAQQKQAETLLLQIDGNLDSIQSQKDEQKAIQDAILKAIPQGLSQAAQDSAEKAESEIEAQRIISEDIGFEEVELDTQIIEVDGRKLLVNTQTGETIQDLGEVDEGLQFVGATKTQPGGVFDKSSGVFIPTGVGAGSVADGVLSNAQKRSLEQADTAIVNIDNILTLLTKGFAVRGALSRVAASKVPGTTSFDLNASLDTVKALIGFDALEKMRLASPTGGALGQVSERELAFLQSVSGSLNIGQSTPQFIDTLVRIKKSFGDVTFIIEATAEGFSEIEIQAELARRNNE